MANSFVDVLGTNYIPTDEEVLEIQNLIAEPERRISQLEEEIAAAEQHVRNLQRAKAELLSGIEEYRTLISPVRRIPSDVLREIFVHCLSDKRNPTMSCEEAPVLLGRVCSHWRDTCLTTPQLWARLHIAVPSVIHADSASHDSKTGKRLTIPEIMDVRIAATTEWIQRSGRLPLHFSIHEYDGYPPTDYCKQFLRTIFPYRERWASIDINCVASSFLEVYDIPPVELPNLKSISILLTRADNPAPPIPWKDMNIFRAHGIHKVSLAGIPSEISQFPFKWDQLTTLNIRGNAWSTLAVASIGEILNTLQQCPKLVECSLHIGSGADSNITPSTVFPSIVLADLTSLVIYDGVRIPALLASIHAPSLRVLKYTGSRSSRRTQHLFTPSPLKQLLLNVGSSLEKLDVTPAAFRGQVEVTENLALCPNIKALTLFSSPLLPSLDSDDRATFIDGVLQTLAHAVEGEPYICPKVEDLRFEEDVHFSDEAVVAFVMRKCSGEDPNLVPLKSLGINFFRRPKLNVAALIGDHILSDLKLSLRYPPHHYRGPFSLYGGLPGETERDPYLQMHG